MLKKTCEIDKKIKKCVLFEFLFYFIIVFFCSFRFFFKKNIKEMPNKIILITNKAANQSKTLLKLC